MNIIEKELVPGFRRSHMSTVKGNRKRHVVAFNPNKVSAGEELYIDIPKLKMDSCLVPGSFHLLFNFKVSDTKSWFLNNMLKMLQKRLVVRLAGETVYDNSVENIYEVYKDLWKTNSQRLDMVEYGIAGEDLRKLISKDDSGAKTGTTQKVSDALILSIYEHKKKICFDKIIRDHRLYAQFYMNNNFRYIITLPSSSELMVIQSGQTLGTYTLEDLQLEYEIIENIYLANEIAEKYAVCRSLSYEHITLMKTVVWTAASTLLNENINIPRKSMRSIVLLFTKQSRIDSEVYLYPNITEVKLTIEGVPNNVYSQGIPNSRFYEEAKRLFGHKDIKDQFRTVEKF